MEQKTEAMQKVQIKLGAYVCQDHAFSKWPALPREIDAVIFPEMVFLGRWDGIGWDCQAPKFGAKGSYGNGRLYVRGIDNVEVLDASTPVTEQPAPAEVPEVKVEQKTEASQAVERAILTWQERAAKNPAYWRKSSPIRYMEAEIADLRAALKAQPAPTEAPRKATDEMCRAAREKFGISANMAAHIWNHMLSNAPTEAAQAGAGLTRENPQTRMDATFAGGAGLAAQGALSANPNLTTSGVTCQPVAAQGDAIKARVQELQNQGLPLHDDVVLQQLSGNSGELQPSGNTGELAQSEDSARLDAERDVLAERRRQVKVEGWAPARDDGYQFKELAKAAICYIRGNRFVGSIDKPIDTWPWDHDWWKPTTYRGNLVKAGALIIAEIERIDRARASAETGGVNVQPPYPEGDVVGACVCGSWPGGKCLKCPWIPAETGGVKP